MKKSEWSDKQLEELLRQLPKIKDHRDPRDIYQNISFKMKKKKTQWIIPSLATAAAAILFLILTPGLLDFENHSLDKMSNQSEISKGSQDSAKKESISNIVEEKSIEKSNEALLFDKKEESISSKTALYEEEVGEGQKLTYWIPEPQAQFLVPVSLVVDKLPGKTWLDLFIANMNSVTEEAWGLSEYYPLSGDLSLSEDQETLVINVKADHPYAQGSANEELFLELIKRNLTSNSEVKRIEFKTEGNPGIVFGNNVMTNEEVTATSKRAYFVYQYNPEIQPFLVPSRNTYSDITHALNSMKQDVEGQNLRRSLPAAIDFDAEINTTQLAITFSNPSAFTDEKEAILAIESILLTAKEFGLSTVKFENINQSIIADFDLAKEIKVPIAPNKVIPK